MTSTWLLVYALNPALPVAARVDAYPDLGLTFKHDGEGRLAEVEHTVEMVIDAYVHDVIEESELSLGRLWEALEFEYGFPVRYVSRITRLPEPEDSPPDGGTFSSRVQTAMADAAVAAPVTVPSVATIRAPDPRLRRWLSAATSARSAVDPGDALRSYFVVLEDVFGRLADGDVLRTKYVRDFVSHARIDNARVLAFIQAALGSRVTRYAPHDARHIEFVAHWRDVARELAEKEIRRLL